MIHKTSMLGLAGLFCVPLVPLFAQNPDSGAADPSTGLASTDATTALRADVDLDGVQELLLRHPSGRLGLYREVGGKLEALDAPVLGALPLLSSAALGDHDQDAIADLLVATRSGAARLLVGDGAGDFRDVSADVGLSAASGVLAARWEDLDGDGLDEVILSTTAGFVVGRNLGGTLELERLPVESGVALGGTGAAAIEHPDPSPAADPSDRAGAGSVGEGPSPGGQSLTAGATTSIGPAPGGGLADQQPVAACVTGLDDPFGPQCIRASHTPTLGMMYPMSEAFNVGTDGRVGIGTTNPFAQLQIESDGRAIDGRSETGNAAYFYTADFGTPTLQVSTNLSAGVAAQFNGIVNVGFFEPFPVAQNRTRVKLASFGEAGSVSAWNSAGTDTIYLGAQEVAGNGAQVTLSMFDGTDTISLDAEYGTDGTNGARVSLFSRGGNETVEISSQEAVGNGAQIALSKSDGTATIVLDAETARGCEVSLRNSLGVETIEMITEEVPGNGAQIILRKADGSAGITLDAEQGGDGRVITEVLQITGGADLVEGFATGGVDCPPGSVVVIDPARAGELTLSSEPYDFRVAGVVSGAGGVKPGLAMGQAGVLDGDTQVALTGRVYVRCSTEGGAIQPGHLLTTSSTAGVAMRAADTSRANGAVLGKAMGSLDEGTGLILVLVNLQ